jgi:23S rRNA pseudouridine955/2504/2580 synthase
MTLYEIRTPEAPLRLRVDKFIQKSLPALPQYALRDAFLRHDVKMDGRRVKPNEMINADAVIRVYTPVGGADMLNVVYEDEHILIINKPEGVSVTQDSGPGVTVLDLARKHLRGREAYACHRLDNQTSGLLVLAKNSEAEADMRHAFSGRTIDKIYTCLVQGTPEPVYAVKTAYLRKDARHGNVRVTDTMRTGAAQIITEYRVLETGTVARLEIKLITGRTHQIRAHMAYLKHPLLGDDHYGDRTFNRANHAGRLMLCANKITFQRVERLCYLNGRTFTVEVPF